MKCYGRLSVRTILFLVGKQKSGRDGTHWQTLQAILGAYTKEVQDAAGTKATSSAQHEPPSGNEGHGRLVGQCQDHRLAPAPPHGDWPVAAWIRNITSRHV